MNIEYRCDRCNKKFGSTSEMSRIKIAKIIKEHQRYCPGVLV